MHTLQKIFLARHLYKLILVTLLFSSLISFDALAAAAKFTLSAPSYSVTEGGTLTVTVKRSKSKGQATVLIGTNSVTAQQGSDYWGFDAQPVSFASGETSKTVTVQTINDTVAESTESFEVLLSGPSSGYSLGNPAKATVTINDDDAAAIAPQFSLSAATYSVTEGGTLTVTVRRSTSSGTASVLIGTNSVTAFHGSDYWGFDAQPVSFADGETAKTVTVQTINDTVAESTESFEVLLSGPSTGYTLGSPAKASVTVADDDVAASGTATLSWVPPTTNTDGSILPLSSLAGYRIYYGTSAQNLTLLADINDPTITQYVVKNLSSNTYYFTATAYDVNGNESSYSNIASKQIN